MLKFTLRFGILDKQAILMEILLKENKLGCFYIKMFYWRLVIENIF